MLRFASILLILLLAGAGYRADVGLRSFDARQEGNSVVVTWESTSEEGLQQYRLTRRSQASQDRFVTIYETPGKGAGASYRFVDQQLYKAAAEEVEYRLLAVYSATDTQVIGSHRTTYGTSSVRRTWGSIKAMFQ